VRSAPFGLDPHASPEGAFDMAVECATPTHGHPSGYLAAGAFAAMVRALVDGLDLPAPTDLALDLLARHPGHDEVTAALCNAPDGARGQLHGDHGPHTAWTTRYPGG
jgi:ADP-ribosylglycohydrolase